MKFLSPIQVNLNSEGKRHVLYTWQCLHCQECLLDECKDTLHKYSVKMTTDKRRLIYYFMHP